MYDAYWYHPDHLGSSSYISNMQGIVTQHMEYLPFGETPTDEHLNSYNTPYKFNGKELDQETGLYYYGARYYNPRTSIWLSVDPLAEKYPSISPYAYVANNPINAIDPDGRDIIFFNEQGEEIRRVALDGTDIRYKVSEIAVNAHDKVLGYDNGGYYNDVYAASLIGTLREVESVFKLNVIASEENIQVDITGDIVEASDMIGDTQRPHSEYGVRGTISITSIWDDGTSFEVESYDMTSGPWGNGPGPNSTYEAYQYVPTYESGMKINGERGWKVRLQNDYVNNTLKRTGILIHPDTNAEGTAGCFGVRLIGDNSTNTLKQIGLNFEKWLQNGNTFDVNVNITNNPNYNNQGRISTGE